MTGRVIALAAGTFKRADRIVGINLVAVGE